MDDLAFLWFAAPSIFNAIFLDCSIGRILFGYLLLSSLEMFPFPLLLLNFTVMYIWVVMLHMALKMFDASPIGKWHPCHLTLTLNLWLLVINKITLYWQMKFTEATAFNFWIIEGFLPWFLPTLAPKKCQLTFRACLPCFKKNMPRLKDLYRFLGWKLEA